MSTLQSGVIRVICVAGGIGGGALELREVWEHVKSKLSLAAQPKKTADISQRHHWFPLEMTSEKRPQKFHIDDASLLRSGWCSRLVENLHHPIRTTTQIWVVTHHQYRISAIVCQTSFRGKTSGGVAKCRLFSQATRGSSAEKRTNSKPLFYKLNIFSLYLIFKFHVSCFVNFQ